jgi:predicted class III extradiol MEMO1 family dioxygenase
MVCREPLECVESSKAPGFCSEAAYGKLLAPFLDQQENLFVISSDFCHWGSRFNFTFYDESQVIH